MSGGGTFGGGLMEHSRSKLGVRNLDLVSM